MDANNTNINEFFHYSPQLQSLLLVKYIGTFHSGPILKRRRSLSLPLFIRDVVLFYCIFNLANTCFNFHVFLSAFCVYNAIKAFLVEKV